MAKTIKIVLHGDLDASRREEHHGLRLLEILERFMSFQGLTQCAMKKEIRPGLIVEASKVYGACRIDVYVQKGGERQVKNVSECFCNCDFAIGYIVSLEDEKLDDKFQFYEVAVCFKNRTFLLHEHILASDFTEYVVGERVLLIPYNMADFVCCTTGTGRATGCRPVKSELELDDDLWRTDMRIIPWCAVRIPKWRPKNGGGLV